MLCVSFPLGQRAGGIHAPFPILLSSWPRAGGIDAAFFLPALVLANGGWNLVRWCIGDSL